MRQMTRSETSEKVTAGGKWCLKYLLQVFVLLYWYFVQDNLLYFEVFNEATIPQYINKNPTQQFL